MVLCCWLWIAIGVTKLVWYQPQFGPLQLTIAVDR